ncbi:MAG: hypothetical protein BGO47_07620 [Microbacterium sp. 67-17]|uniref:hypothetical protein n=1 Tax=Microbacterium sp. 67-17 TaxID=1895782 RepID=UPI0009634EE2|nr:hypothetical protein [Microbacterium sp. 67-17]OJV98158.1 MAG: hypothetical protein BGO47_07620 [Microbacterium sp. 67-17]
MDSNSLITLMIGFGVVAVLGLVVGWAMWESNKAEATSDRREPVQRMPRYPDMSSPAVTTATVRTVAGPRPVTGTPMTHPYAIPQAAYQQQPQAPQFAEGTTEYVYAPNPSAQPVNVASAAFGPAPAAYAPEQPAQPPVPPLPAEYQAPAYPAGDEPVAAAPAPAQAAPAYVPVPPAAPAPPPAPALAPPATAPVATAAPGAGYKQTYATPPRTSQTSVFRLGRVLWVDDDPDSHVPDVVALHRMGLTVTVARHCEAALAYLAAEKYLLVVTDCGREGDAMTAADFIRTVRRNYPGVPTIAYAPGAIVTGPGAPELPHDQVVTTPGELPSVVGRLLGR